MKNKKVLFGILVIAAVALFTVTAFVSVPGNEGYEALKQIMKDSKATEAFDNASFDGSFQVSDNGKVITEFAGKVKGNHEGKEASGNVQINLTGKMQDLSFYKNSDTAYLVDENNAAYYQFVNTSEEMNRKHEYSRKDFSGERRMGNTGEALMDYFMGDLKSQFELSQNADGSKTITLDLDQNEIPAPLNLMAGLAVENKNKDYSRHYESQMDPVKKAQLIEKMPFLKDFSDMKNVMPELKEDVKLTGIFTRFDFDANNKIKAFDIKMDITGRDENGTIHEIIFTGSADINDINSTTVDAFNPDGKSIEIIDSREFEDNNNQY